MGFCSRGEISSTLSTRQVEIYSQGAGWGSVDGKLLRGNINGKGEFWLNRFDRILAEGRPG